MIFVCLESEAAFGNANLVVVLRHQSVYGFASVAIDPPPFPEVSPPGKEGLAKKENRDIELGRGQFGK